MSLWISALGSATRSLFDCAHRHHCFQNIYHLFISNVGFGITVIFWQPSPVHFLVQYFSNWYFSVLSQKREHATDFQYEETGNVCKDGPKRAGLRNVQLRGQRARHWAVYSFLVWSSPGQETRRFDFITHVDQADEELFQAAAGVTLQQSSRVKVKIRLQGSTEARISKK